MSFITITPTEITSGEPVASTTQTKIKDNFDDHEARLEIVEASFSQFIPIIFRVNGFYRNMVDVVKTTANSSLFIIGARILIDGEGTTGTTQIDIKKKRGSGSFTSIFTTLPSVAVGPGDNSLSTNGIIDLTQYDIIAGDIIRLDITSSQTQGNGFLVRIDWNRG